MDEILDFKGHEQPRQPAGYGKQLPNAAAILVLGIISIVTCWLWGIPGLVCGIIALVLYKKDRSIYFTDPAAYEQSFKNARAGQICAIIGICLSGIMLLMLLFSIIVSNLRVH